MWRQCNTSDKLQTFASLENRPALRTVSSSIPDVYICSATTVHVWHYKRLMRSGKARRSSDATRFYHVSCPSRGPPRRQPRDTNFYATTSAIIFMRCNGANPRSGNGWLWLPGHRRRLRIIEHPKIRHHRHRR